ncbi:hypothetical protein D6D05_00125 [Aureobasidium pullulans]|nr:hypothetical protein D6D05_00125 [Aureobasidium pullulans]
MVTVSSPIERHVPSRPHGRPNECPVNTHVDARAIHNCIRRISSFSPLLESPASRLVVGASLSASSYMQLKAPNLDITKSIDLAPTSESR